MAGHDIHKKIESVFSIINKKTDARIGFVDMNLWTDSGVYALNRKLSNDYHKCILYGSQFGLYGESGSGKSLLLAQMASIEQKKRNAFVLWFDVEGAVSDKIESIKWFSRIGVDTSDTCFRRVHICTFTDALSVMAEFVKMWREDEFTKQLPPLFVVFDSYSHLITDSMVEQNKGKKDLTSDMGQKAKQLGDFLVRTKGMIEGLRICITGVMHVYMNQDMYGPSHKISGGMKAVFTAAQSLMLTKSEMTNEWTKKYAPWLTQSNEPEKMKDIIGVKVSAKTLKTRYAKPFERIDLQAVYGKGIDKYSGLFDMMLEDNIIISPSQGWYEFSRPDGTKQKFRKSEFTKYAEELLLIPIPERTELKEEEVDKLLFDENMEEME
jgi:RecA/RadA recombinase